MNALCNFMSSRSLNLNSREKLRMHVASIIHVKNNMNAHILLEVDFLFIYLNVDYSYVIVSKG